MKSKIHYMILSWLTVTLSVGVVVICLSLLFINQTIFLWLFFSFYLLSLIFALIILNHRRNEDAKLSWLIVIFGIPFLGIILYFLFGRGFPKKAFQKQMKKINSTKNIDWNEHQELCNSSDITETEKLIIKRLGGSLNAPFVSNKSLKILGNGSISYEEMFSEIEKAKKYIYVSYYIISDGVVLESFFELLRNKVAKGVKVYFIYDPIGSFLTVSAKNIDRFKKAGINIVDFTIKTPFGKGSLLNYRYHRKLILIDGVTAMFGGINIGNEYGNLSQKYGYWHDNFIKVSGNSVANLQKIFLNDWNHINKNNNIEYINKTSKKTNKTYMQVIDAAPYYNDSQLLTTFFHLISNAEKRIHIMTPYLIIPQSIITLLQNAASRGVDVKIITPSFPDKKGIFDLTQMTYKPLISHGIKIFEFQNSFLHSKMGIFDDKFTMLGSVNLDNRSLFQNFELACVVYSKNTNTDCFKLFNETLASSKPIKKLPTYNWRKKLKLSFLNVMSPLF